ncbi:MAG: hypothetical protein A2V70_05075 [Planctomycetes bacterium RBG_13_63_9]|nr:MAG: hypothetical protein A2V70_05075 [Planctomycetes bacterium RBG_13_63_9]
MNGKPIPCPNPRPASRLLILCVGLWCCGCVAAQAASPLAGLLTFNRVQADPEREYRLTEDNGPWTIMACSFSGDGAAEQAKELALELRKRYKLEAYTHPMNFKFGATRGRGIDRYGAPLRMRHRRDDLQEVAVLVGDYASVDDPRAQKVLQKLKYSLPRCLEVEKGQPTHQSLAGWRMTQKQFQEFIGSRKKDKGPMGHAFVTTNPLLPKEYFNSPGIDPLVLEMNKSVTHSLLDCRGKYTVQVATFKGNVVIDQGEIEEIERGKRIESELAKAAEKAHRLTEALRVKGWEAYEFHDRYASIVTVGSFNSIGTQNAAGQIELNSGVHAIMETFKAQPTTLPGQAAAATALKSLVGIPFDVQPIPVEVPKRSIRHEMARRLF